MTGIIRKKNPGEAWESLPDTGNGDSQPIVQGSAPDQGVNAYYFMSGTPLAPWTATFAGQTTDPIAADATTQDICDALELLSTIGAGNVTPYPGTEDDTLPDDNVYVLFIRELGAQPVEAFTVSDPAITVGGDDRAGVLPDPEGTTGQLLAADDAAYMFLPDLNSEQASSVWRKLTPIPVITLGGASEVEVEAEGVVYVRSLLDGHGLVAQYLASLGKYYLDAATSLGDLTFSWAIGGDEHTFQFFGGTAGVKTSLSLLTTPGGISLLNAAGDQIQFTWGSADPTAGGGVIAPIGSTYSRTTDGTEWKKTGAGDTAWEQLAFVP